MFYFLIFIIISILYFLLPKKTNTLKAVHLKYYIFPCSLIFMITFIIIFSNNAYNAAHTAFILWVNNVIPSLLPFFICIELLKQSNFMQIVGKFLTPIMRPIFNVPGSGAFALAMGITSGYPVGAKVASDLYKDKLCSKIEAERLIAFTNSSGPLFIIGAIGIGMFSDDKIGLILLITHFLASITTGILFRFYKKRHEISDIISQVSINSNSINLSNLGSSMATAINKSISTLLLIGGYIVFFAVLNEILSSTLLKSIENQIILGILNGILEITSGIKKLSLIENINYITLLPIVSLILGFGGFSVHMQVASILSESNLSMKPYLLGKLLQGIFASFYTFLLMKYTSFFNLEVVTAFNYYGKGLPFINESFNIFRTIVSLFFISIVIAIIYKVTRSLFVKRKNDCKR